MLTPFTFTPDRSNEVLEKTKLYLEDHGLSSKISELGWIYQSAQGTIPHTHENLWSGHFFPMIDSWEELQVSFNLCAFGFYKQAMTSLRSGLETGLLSVYWNLEDDGHVVVQNWLRSQEDTPRLVDIWKRLKSNTNIAAFQEEHNLKERLLDLGFLHNYVHTKGHRYSNSLGLLKSNTQTFEEKGLLAWLSAFREVVVVVTVLHLLKYPVAVVRYDWSAKFGIDIPSLGCLRGYDIDRISKAIGDEYFETINAIAASDPQVAEIMEWITGLDDMTEEEKENQWIELDKHQVQTLGLHKWLEQEKRVYAQWWDTERVQRRIAKTIKWAEENGYLEPMFPIPKDK